MNAYRLCGRQNFVCSSAACNMAGHEDALQRVRQLTDQLAYYQQQQDQIVAGARAVLEQALQASTRGWACKCNSMRVPTDPLSGRIPHDPWAAGIAAWRHQ